jgi:hypothetical protein
MKSPSPGKEIQGWRVMRALTEEVEKLLRGAGDQLLASPKTGWVSFKSAALRRVFAEIRPHRRDVEVFILPPVEDLRRPNGLASPSPPSQGWGWFRSKFRVRRVEEVVAAADLLFQSYLHRKEMSRRSGRKSR